MEKKNIIWSNLNIDYGEWEDDWEDYLDMNDLTKEDSDLYQWVDETNGYYLDDERCNLNKAVEGVIVCFAQLGMWDGIHQGAKTCGSNVRNILYSNCEYCEWYCDRYNVRCTAAHHDGRNSYLYRVAKDMETAKRLVDRIASGTMSETLFKRCTKSLKPYVVETYGWK